MTKLNKILLAGLICTAPLGLFAYDKYDNNHEKHENHKERCFESSDYDDDFSKYEREYYEKKGVNYVFEGRLEELPKLLSGIWKISGKSITVDDNTIISQSDKPFQVGDELYIAAKRVGSKIIAVELEQED